MLFVYLYGLFSSQDFFNTLPLCFRSQPFWLALLLVPLLLALSDCIFEAVLRALDPSDHDMLVALLDRDAKAGLIHEGSLG